MVRTSDCRPMVSLDSARRYARGMTGCRNPQLTLTTQSGHPDFSEAAGQADQATASFVAMKLPFVTSHTRPSAVGHGYISILKDGTGPNPLEWRVCGGQLEPPAGSARPGAAGRIVAQKTALEFFRTLMG